MDIKELHHTLNKEIYEQAFRDLNLILGHSKSSSTSAGIYLKLPITLVLTESNKAPTITLQTSSKELLSNWQFYVIRADATSTITVNMELAYHPDQDLTRLYKRIKKDYALFSLIYFHELQHILSFHTLPTFDRMMQSICTKAGVANKNEQHHLINCAEDFRINYTINMYCKGTTLEKTCKDFLSIGIYEPKYERKALSEIDILKDMLTDKDKYLLNLKGMLIDAISGNTEESGDSTEAISEGELKDLADSLQSSIESALRGSGKLDSLSEIIKPIDVNTGWFDKLEKTFTRLVYYATNDYSVTWSNLNSIYRKHFKAPKRIYYDDSVSIILAIDQSGSMRIKDMGKLLSLIQTKASKILKLTVLIHDYEVGHTFELSGEYGSITESKEFTEALATRRMSGGTSHIDVFKKVSEMKNLKDSIFIAFTDGYSDLESFTKYPKLRELNSKIVLLTENNPQNLTGWKEIRMQ